MSSELEQHLNKLDTLLEEYLNLLDSYQRARQDLSKSLASGFFSLARANKSAPGGRRFGQDYYDHRMQASLRVQIQGHLPNTLFIQRSHAPASGTQHEDAKSTKEDASNVRDPINWYGVLVPSFLRDAQKYFISSVENSLPDVFNIGSQIRQLEIDIGRTRKTIRKLETMGLSNLQPSSAVVR